MNKLYPRFSRLLRHQAWNSGTILKGKDKGEVTRKGNYKQEEKDASYRKQKEASDKVNEHINNL